MLSSGKRAVRRAVLPAIAALFSVLYLAYGWVLRCSCHPLWGECHCGDSCGCPKYWSPWMGLLALITLGATQFMLHARRRRLVAGTVC